MTGQKDKLNQEPGFTLAPDAKKKLWGTELVPGYVYGPDAAEYLCTTERKISLFRRYGLLEAVKLGKGYVYKVSQLDAFWDEWKGYDLSNEEAVKFAIREKEWRKKHAG